MRMGKLILAHHSHSTGPALATGLPKIAEAAMLARPRDLDYLDLLDDSYSQICKYSPALLETFTFWYLRYECYSKVLAEIVNLYNAIHRIVKPR